MKCLIFLILIVLFTFSFCIADIDISFNKTAVLFDTTKVGETTYNDIIAINQGTEMVSIDSIYIDSDNFKTDIDPSDLMPGDSLFIDISFEPDNYGQNNGTIYLYSDDFEVSLTSASLSGFSLFKSHTIKIEPDFINFGIVGMTDTVSQSVLIQNIGYSDLEIHEAHFEKGVLSPFSIYINQVVLTAGESTEIDIFYSYKPRENQTIIDTLVISSNDSSNSNYQVILIAKTYRVFEVPTDFFTIQGAIDSVLQNDTILVAPGTYYEHIEFGSKTMYLGSYYYKTKDSTYITNTIIDGQNDGIVVKIFNHLSSYTVLDGFTITNGNWDDYASGIACYNANTTLKNLIVSNNSGRWGGIVIEDSKPGPLLENVKVLANEGSWGGGIHCDNSYITLKKVTISGNSAMFGGGFYCNENSKIYLENLLLSGNTGTFGAGMNIQNSQITIMNATISKNISDRYGSGISLYNSELNLINSIVWFNNRIDNNILLDGSEITVDHCIIQSGEEGIFISSGESGDIHWLNGNQNIDPKFVNPEFQIFSLQNSSEAIGAGVNSVQLNDGITYYAPENDINCQLRPAPLGTNVDVGAYENKLGDPIVSIPINKLDSKSFHFSLNQNYPNPFNPITTINYELGKNSFVKLNIYGISGEKVKTLVNKYQASGNYSILFDASSLASGVYFYVLSTDSYKQYRKMILLQ